MKRILLWALPIVVLSAALIGANERVVKPRRALAEHKRRALLTHQLVLACQDGNSKRACDLLRRGADPNARDSSDGRPLFFYALGAQQEDDSMLKAFVSAGANLNARWLRDRNRTALFESAETCGGCGCVVDADAIEWLLDSGARTDVSDQENNTPLHCAVDMLDFDSENATLAITLLMQHGANPTKRNAQGKTPLDLLKDTNSDNSILDKNLIASDKKLRRKVLLLFQDYTRHHHTSLKTAED